jgi:TRAP transporter TAXI family solute receptor
MLTNQIKRGSFFVSVTALLCIGVLFFGVSTGLAQSSSKNPDMIRLMTYDLGSTAYVMYGFLGEAMVKRFGTRLRAIPAGNDIARMIPVRAGQAQFAGQGGDAYYAAEGLDRYADISWGPQPLRCVWHGQQPGTVGMVRGTSDIKTCADLKGKRLPWIPGSVFIKYYQAWLAFANLTWDDVEKVQIAGFGAAMRALIDGKVDMTIGAVTVPPAYELESSPYGLRYIELPASNKEGWARVQEIQPYLFPYKATYGAGISEGKYVEVASNAYPTSICYDFLDEDIAYFMTKAIHECYPDMAKKSELMKRFWSIEGCLSFHQQNRGAIFHPGSVKYFKEIGVWKPEWDKLREKRLERQRRLKELWENTMDEAEEKKVKAKDYADFWLKKHAETFPELPD